MKLFPYLKTTLFYIKAVKISSRHFWKFYELIPTGIVLFSIWPVFRLFSVSIIRTDIRQVKSSTRPDTGYKKGRIVRKFGFRNFMNWYGSLFNLAGSGYFLYPVYGHIAGKSNPVSGRISSASLIKTLQKQPLNDDFLHQISAAINQSSSI
jgi:hypothetical protein